MCKQTKKRNSFTASHQQVNNLSLSGKQNPYLLGKINVISTNVPLVPFFLELLFLNKTSYNTEYTFSQFDMLPADSLGREQTERQGLEAVQPPLTNTQSSAMLSALSVQNTELCVCLKKRVNPILARTSKIPHQNLYKLDKT